MRSFLICCAGILLALAANAQSSGGFIKGRVTSADHKPLEKASVSLLQAADSSLVTAVFTDPKGDFEMHDLKQDKYLLVITYLGYAQIQKFITVTAEKNSFDLGTLTMSSRSVDLNAVTVKEIAPPVALKGDTMEFNAGSFQTRPNAVVEDLLKKIPGVQVDKDGNITAEGETVTQILVDGKPFFGTDPKLATKNLPVNVIDKVQVFDKLSDQAAFTGIDDGNTSKAINLTIKKDKKKGLFGRAAAGGGTDSRFMTQLSLFRFNNDQQISLLGSGNNTNNLGFTFNDIRGGGGGGGGRGGGGRGGRGGGGDFMSIVNTPGGTGVTTAWMGGLNYRDQWSDKLSVTGNYFYNHTGNDVIQQADRQYILPDTTYYNTQNSHAINNSTNQRFDLRMEYQIDSMNSIWFTPSVSYTTNNYSTTSDYAAQDAGHSPVNDGHNLYTTSNTSPNLSGNLLYRRRFAKEGRTFSLNLNGGYSTNDGSGVNNSYTNYYDEGVLSSTDTVDQRFTQDATTKSWGVRATYTEPLFAGYVLEVHLAHSNNLNLSDKYTYNQDPYNGKFNVIDSTYTNAFRNTYQSNQAGFNIQQRKLRYNYTVGMNVQRNSQESYSITGDSTIGQHTLNFFPEGYFNYTFSKNQRLRFYYRGSTTQPSISQLQPVPDNSDPLNTKLGNPDLKTSFTNSFRLNYRSFDMTNYHMFFANLSFSTESNDIVNSTTYNTSGQQTQQYVNANGNYNASAFVTAGLPIKHSRNMVNSHTSINMSRDVSFINGDKNYTKSLNITQGLSLNYALEELLDFRLAGSVNYNKANYSLQSSQNTNYFNYDASIDFNINLPAHFTIQTDFDYTANTGRAAGYNQNISMWNASVSKYVFSKQQGMIRLQAFDLLNQHTSVTRSVEANYIQDARTNVIPQYFMLSFTYFLNKFPSDNDRRGGRMMGRPPGGYRGGGGGGGYRGGGGGRF